LATTLAKMCNGHFTLLAQVLALVFTAGVLWTKVDALECSFDDLKDRVIRMETRFMSSSGIPLKP